MLQKVSNKLLPLRKSLPKTQFHFGFRGYRAIGVRVEMASFYKGSC